MEKNLLLAFLLMGAVMFLSQYFFKSQQPAVPPKTAATETAASKAPATPPGTPPAEAPAAEAKAQGEASVAATSQPPLPALQIDTDLYHVTISNQGATIRGWRLKKFKGNDGKELDLVNTVGGTWPLSLHFPAQQPAGDVNWAWYKQTLDPDGLGAAYEYSDGHTTVRKTFRFQKNSYLSRVSAEVTIDGKPVPSMLQWRYGFGDLTVGNPASNQLTLFYDLAKGKLTEWSASTAKNGPVTASGNFSFAGIADKYFAAVFLPEANTNVEKVTFSDSTRTVLEEKPAAFAGVAVGDTAQNRFDLFVGPKDMDILAKVNPKLVEVVNFGFLSILAKPLFLVVNWLNDAAVHNFGWSIVIVTIIINFILFPLKLSNMKSMRKMQALKPQIDAINAKYKNLKMTDPKKADQQQETMDLYKKHGVNPMGGCVPMLLQIPFFIAFLRVFTVSVEMRSAHWLWVTDLSQPEQIAIHILPIIMIASQFFMQKMTPQPAGTDPSQQKMMMFMPIIFGVMFYNLPSGLVLYYLTSNLVSMGQQWFFNHTEAAQEAARSVEPPKKKNGRK
jgi:YidC/Oxa1 family membrane protein insertase